MALYITQLAVFAFAARLGAAVTCRSTFTPITSSDFISNLNPGWNAGNSLDAIPTETSWGQPLLVNSTFTNVKSHGFKGVRLPVTWADHFLPNSTTWDIDPTWLQRVSDVVDMVLSNGLYVIVNAHHDSWNWLDPTVPNANLTMMTEKFYRLWYQVGSKLSCKSSLLAFEALNEPSGSSASDAAFLTHLQTTFIRAINDAGGFNSQRVIVLGGLGDSIQNAVQYFKAPEQNVTNPWALTYHYYGPWDFTATAFGRTIWGSSSDKASMEADFAQARGNYSNIPLLIGEFATPPLSTETAARWKWYDFLVRTASKYNTSVMLWDAGGSFAVNSSSEVQVTFGGDETAIDIIMFAAAGVPNLLPESTTDPDAETQTSSAFVWMKEGVVGDVVLGFIWNETMPKELPLWGNGLTSILGYRDPGNRGLVLGTDYTINGTNVTLKASYLSTLFGGNETNGLKATIFVNTERGASLQLQAYQWAAPTLGWNSSRISNGTAQDDLAIPISWQGKPQLATVKAQMVNGSYLVDTWTQWLGPLQRGRMTYSGQWDFNATHVILKSKALQAVVSANESTVFTFEFYPRQPDNVVNYTLYI